jgi:hypothetical protein
MIAIPITTATRRAPRSISGHRMITSLGAATDLVNTSRGQIPFGQWLEQEQQRLSAHGVESEIFTTSRGLVCLLRKD